MKPTEEVLAIEVGVSIPSARVVRVLEQLVEIYGCPKAVRCDNGPEFVAQAFMDWAKERSVEVIFIQHGKPDQNAFVERFNRTYRQEVLNTHLFGSVAQAQAITDRWMQDYNKYRPHDALGKIPPATYLPRPTTPEKSSYELCP